MKYAVFFLLIVILASCQSIERTPKPDNLIEEDKMVDILVELSLFDAAKRLNSNRVNVRSIEIQDFIYEKFNVDSTQLANSNAFYAENLKTYEPIFDSVQKRLERLKVELDTLKAIDDRKKDSINELKKDKDSLKLKPSASDLKLLEPVSEAETEETER